MRPSRPAGLLVGVLLLASIPAGSVASPASLVGPPRAPQNCGMPGGPPCPPANTPAIAVAKTAAPANLPAGGGSVTYTYTVTNPGTVPLMSVTVTDDTCAPVTFVGGDTNSNGVLDLTETWVFTCTMTLTKTTTNKATASGRDASGSTTNANASATVTVGEGTPCQPGSTDPNCVPQPCPPGVTGPNCPPPPPPPPQQTTLVWECFDLIGKLNPNVPVRLVTRNFGNDTVLVRRSEKMCEPALKTRHTPPKGTLAPVVHPNAELNLVLIDPRGASHQVMLEGPLALQRITGGGVYDTEMLQLMLQGTAPLHVVSADGSFFDSFFDVFVELDPRAVSPGRLDSFFDIFPEIALSHSMMLGEPDTMTLMPSMGLRLLSNHEGGYELGQAPVPLNDSNGRATGWSIAAATLVPSAPGTPGQTAYRAMECFTLEHGADRNQPYALQTRNFGLDPVTVHKAIRMCEGAVKSRQVIASGSNLQPPPVVWECWSIVSPRPFSPRTFVLTTRNFGPDPVRVIKQDTLCEEAAKIRVNAAGQVTTIGEPTGRVLECFRIQGKVRNLPFFLRTRNFGLDTVRIQRGTLLCEPAVKKPLTNFVGP